MYFLVDTGFTVLVLSLQVAELSLQQHQNLLEFQLDFIVSPLKKRLLSPTFLNDEKSIYFQSIYLSIEIIAATFIQHKIIKTLLDVPVQYTSSVETTWKTFMASISIKQKSDSL